MNRTIAIYLLFLLLFNTHLIAQNLPSTWADSVYNSLSLDQKIGQLFMVRSSSKNDPNEIAKLSKLITDEYIGGLCFFQGDPIQQALLTNKYQIAAPLPLLISIDGEWGLGMRHKSQTISYPRQLMLGAIQDDNLIYEMGTDIAEQFKRIGVNINFAPVVDINNNKNNPVINDRSFGEDKYNVAAKGYAYMKGMQDHGLMACAKHFPGHGDTDVDSHLDLPIINHNLQRLTDLELTPFQSLIDNNIYSIMVAHLHIPALDKRPNRATTLSRSTVTDLLRFKMNFQGLIFTDALEMKGVAKHFPHGEVEAEALLAGNDILLLPEDIVKAKLAIKNYLNAGKISMDQINQSVKRILSAKAKFHLTNTGNIDTINLLNDLNHPKYLSLKSQLIENALTLVNNEQSILPITNMNQKFMCINFGSPSRDAFQKRLDNYAHFEHYNLSNDYSSAQASKILLRAKKNDLIIISINTPDKTAKSNFGLTTQNISFIKQISKENKVLLVIFGSPYAVSKFDVLNNILVAYEDNDLVKDITAQSIFGVNPILGKLPVTASSKYYVGLGISVPSMGRLGFADPERVGLSSDTLSQIASIVDNIISTKAAPGCQVLIAKDGKIAYHKSFGHFKYNNLQPVSNQHIYDIASITKIMSTTLAMMHLVDHNDLDIYAPINYFIPQADTCNKSGITICEMMAHHARLKPWIPFYKNTVIQEKRKVLPNPNYYRSQLSDNFEIPVAERMFLRTDYRDSIWSQIYTSELRDEDSYRYSDLGFFLSAKVIENLSGMPLDKFVSLYFYKPLGLRKTGYKPLYWIPKYEIAPTEIDDYFRNQELQGAVHDMGAAMLGGVSGHAGVFSNSYELAIISQMLLNKGTYGGINYLNPETIDRFTRRYYKSSRRGIGFDMKELDSSSKLNISELASDRAYGHYGFTGTALFVDPTYNLIYIFLSNRTYPSMNNNRLNREDFRSKIQTIAYKALMANV